MAARDHYNSGNDLFADEDYESAIEEYTKAIDLDENQAEFYVKRANALYKVGELEDVIADCNEALRLDNNNVKALQRKGLAAFDLEEYQTSLTSFQKALELDPSNRQFKTWVRKCLAELDAEGTAVAPAVSKPVETPTEKSPKSPNTAFKSSVAPAAPVPEKKSAVKHEWYQNQSHVMVSLFAKGVDKAKLDVQYTKRNVSISFPLPSGSDYIVDWDLFDEIVPSESSVFCGSVKIELKIKKANNLKWEALERNDSLRELAQGQVADEKENIKTYPSSKGKKNWDSLLDDEEVDDNEDGLNKLLKDVFSRGNDETKRAMMKSFVESGGTVLSTNWDEVGKGEVKGSPPEGMEAKKYEY